MVLLFSKKTRTHTFNNFSTNVQLACAIIAGLRSVVERFAELRFDAAAAELNAGGFPSIEISLALHFEPFFTRRKLFPL